MPYVSRAQQGFFNSPAGRAKIGAAEVDKWNRESKGVNGLPKHVPKRAGDPPDADLTMRPETAPIGMSTGLPPGGAVGGAKKMPAPGPARFPKPVKMPGLHMVKPKTTKAVKPPAPAGTRTMARKPFGSMVPSVDDEGVGGL